MEITHSTGAELSEIKLKGRMDAVWSDHVARALAECVRSGQHAIALDMAEVDYISSAGIRILVLYSRQLKSIQGRFTVINASINVKKVLELAGLKALLHTETVKSAATAATTAETTSRKVAIAQDGAMAEVFDLEPTATLRVDWPGKPAPWLEGRSDPGTCSLVEFSLNVMGLGLGAFGSGDSSDAERFGEFLAAAGSTVCQPADGSNKPDYMLLQGALTPTIKVAYGMLGRGGFARLLRFDKGAQHPSLPLSVIAKACLDAVQSDAAGIVMVAETATLVGASLQKTPSAQTTGPKPGNIFAFPGIRDWLSFTAETAFANSICLIVGFAASKARASQLRLLKPLVASGELCGHFHAAAFPYRPLRKGKVDLRETAQPLFESEHVLGVLHLLNDWREATGAGESRFLRGACWCSPLTT
ncbi:MAG: STAS domain-containing protein [Verrucomicrobiia bacterium]|jgi:anti-anti-sigma factor